MQIETKELKDSDFLFTIPNIKNRVLTNNNHVLGDGQIKIKRNNKNIFYR